MILFPSSLSDWIDEVEEVCATFFSDLQFFPNVLHSHLMTSQILKFSIYPPGKCLHCRVHVFKLEIVNLILKKTNFKYHKLCLSRTPLGPAQSDCLRKVFTL